MPEEILGGKYELIRRLGVGGMAEVFLARQTGIEDFEKLVVIKRILPAQIANEQSIRMFLDEARTAADLSHPNVVTIFEIGEHEGTYFIAMEYLHGHNLRDIWKQASSQREAIPWGQSLRIVIDVARGLHYAHEKRDLRGQPLGIVHRDVSPHNVMVTSSGVTKILDFGIAMAATKTSVTTLGQVRGKANYMSPEQVTGGDLDRRSDQFSLGIILHELTTGRRLFNKDTSRETMKAILREPTPRPSSFMDYDGALEAIVLRALAKKREDRFDSCEEFADALEEFMRASRIAYSASRLSRFVEGLFGDEIQDSTEIVLSEPGTESLLEETTDAEDKTGRATIAYTDPEAMTLPEAAQTSEPATPPVEEDSFIRRVEDFLGSQTLDRISPVDPVDPDDPDDEE